MIATGNLNLEAISGFLSKLAEKSSDVYWLSSPDFERIAYISPAYEEVWGRSREELMSNPEQWVTFLHPDDVETHHPIHEMRDRIAQEGGKARYEESYRIVRPNGDIRWILDRGFPIIDEDGHCKGVTGVAIDVTKEKQIEHALKEAKEKAELANKSKTDFLMNIRHDFRTPFTGIVGMADFMEQMETDAEKKENLGDIVQAAKTLLDLHNEIFEFASLEDGALPILDKPFDLHQLLMDEKNMMISSAKQKQLSLDFNYEPNLPQHLIGDKMRTHRILMNLLSNAIKFTETGSVSLYVSCLKQEVGRSVVIKFVVTDTGCGIPEDKQNLIYEKFTRLSQTYNSSYQGFGCGLRIVKRFLDDLDGEVSVENQHNNGSVFTVLIPFKLSYESC